jgi:hypothetical protein
MKLVILLFSLFTCFLNASSLAIDTFQLDFQSNKLEKKYVDIVNHDSKNKAFVEVVLEELVLTKEQEKIYKKIENNQEGLLITPNKFILQKNGDKKNTKRINFINLHKGLNKEKIYRATYFPRISDQDKFSSGNQFSVKVIVVYETYIYVKPEIFNFSYEYKIDNTNFFLKNNGNSSFVLTNGQECLNNVCTPLTNMVIMADREKNFTIKEGAEIKYIIKHSNNKLKEVTFK